MALPFLHPLHLIKHQVLQCLPPTHASGSSPPPSPSYHSPGSGAHQLLPENSGILLTCLLSPVQCFFHPSPFPTPRYLPTAQYTHVFPCLQLFRGNHHFRKALSQGSEPSAVCPQPLSIPSSLYFLPHILPFTTPHAHPSSCSSFHCSAASSTWMPAPLPSLSPLVSSVPPHPLRPR